MSPKANRAARENEDDEAPLPKSREKLQERVREAEQENERLRQNNQVLTQLYQSAKQKLQMAANDLDAYEHRAQNIQDQINEPEPETVPEAVDA